MLLLRVVAKSEGKDLCSVRWKKWVINWALGLNENSFNGCTKKGSKGWAKWLQGWRKSVEIIYGRSLVDSWQWPGGLPSSATQLAQHDRWNTLPNNICKVLSENRKNSRSYLRLSMTAFLSSKLLILWHQILFVSIPNWRRKIKSMQRLFTDTSDGLVFFAPQFCSASPNHDILLFAFAIKRGYYWVTYWPFSR